MISTSHRFSGLPPSAAVPLAGQIVDVIKAGKLPGLAVTYELDALRAQVAALEKERRVLRQAVRDCARTLQHNLSMWAIKDEQMMMRSLEHAWSVVGREFCEQGQPTKAESDRDHLLALLWEARKILKWSISDEAAGLIAKIDEELEGKP
jgi:hypothetical protein